MTDYQMLLEDMQALLQDTPYQTACLANASSLLFDSLPDVNWVGFYLMEDGQLVLGPFQGKPACVQIAVGAGVCGTAVQRKQSILVEDVHAFSGHIACDSASRSELVLPLLRQGEVLGVLDIDSPTLCRFTEEDRVGLTRIADAICHSVFGGGI